MKKTLLVLAVLALAGATHAQAQGIAITKEDMPQPGEDYEVVNVMPSMAADYLSSGANHTWDFSQPSQGMTAILSYLSMQKVPMAIRASFIGKANLALLNATPDIGGEGFPAASDVYSFYRNADTRYENLGVSFAMQGFPLTGMFNRPDVLFQFPLKYPNTSASLGNTFSFSIPFMGTYYRKQDRNVSVEGYGTLKTPYGTWDVIHVVTYLHVQDSIASDDMNLALPPRTEVYVQWLAKGIGTPVMQVTGSLNQNGDFQPQSATYMTKAPVSVADAPAAPNFGAWYAHGAIQLKNVPSGAILEVFSVDGKKLLQARHTGQLSLDVPRQPLYLVRCTTPQGGTASVKVAGER